MIKSLTDGISTWIVRCGCRLLDVIHGVQLGDYSIFKTFNLIIMNGSKDPIDVEPLVDYDLGDGKCILVVHNEGLIELGKGISQYEDVLFTIS